MIRWLKKLIGIATTVASPSSEATSTSSTESEFTAEVVRITRILPHPGADKLELARFEMKSLGETAYEVVVQKGTMKVGDLAAYFSVDCILPVAHPDFAFLAARLDGVGKTHFRLRAARLRGVSSQGLLIPLPNTTGSLSYGTPVAELYGVSYHQDPEPIGLGPTQATTKPKAQPCPVYGVDSLKKLPRLFDEGEQVFITEKIHGTNMRFGWVRRKLFGIPVGYKFVVGSHRVMKNGSNKGHYYGTDIWSRAADTMQLAERTKNHKGMVFYGELYGHTYDGSKIQDLTYSCDPARGPKLAVFDIKVIKGNYWIDPWEREDICMQAGVPTVPVLNACARFEPGLAEDYAENHVSTVDRVTIREGCVIESLQGPRRKAKFVSQAYLERKGAS